MSGDGWTSRLTAGLAAYIAAAGLGTWRPDGTAYPVGAVDPIFIRDMPDDPDRVTVLTPYSVSDMPGRSDLVQGMQIRCRGGRSDTRGAEDLGDDLYELLHGATHYQLAGIRIAQSWRQSAVPLGRDGNHRWEHASNYYLQTDRATPHTTD